MSFLSPVTCYPSPEASLPVLDPNEAAFPASDLVDFSSALDAPAGKHGFVFAGTDGHFYFQDGRRARFWGINVAKDAVFVPKETIDQAASCLASAGLNLVRLHHVDGTTGLLPAERAGDPERIDPAKLDLLFYWVHALKQRGIYAYLDLLDFRSFQEAEGVSEAAKLDRAAKPAAVFSERLIELQLRYAHDLLFGRPNPYTGLPLGADPAVALVEVCDENGLFARQERWTKLPASYVAELNRRWDFWLRAEYGSTDRLRQAWTGADGQSALAPDERLEDHSVRMLVPRAPDTSFPSPTGSSDTSPGRAARDRDTNRFCYSVHCDYFAEMKDALTKAGLQVPVTAVTEWENPADLRSVADGLDFVGCNWYYDHPVFPAGREWHLPSFFTNANPIADDLGLDFTSSVLRASVARKPLVVREWGVCWPSKFRGAGLLEAVAYGALQDLDGLILFTYNTDPAEHRIEYFDVSSDPARWALVGVAGAVYRDRLVAPAQRHTAIGFSAGDAFGPQWSSLYYLYRLGWVSQLRQLLFEDTCDSRPYDVVVASGQSAAASYSGPNVVLHLSALNEEDGAALLRHSGYRLDLQPTGRAQFVFDGFCHNPGEAITLGLGPRFSVLALQAANLEPLGVNADGTLACGLLDPQRKACVFTPVGVSTVLRGALDLLAGDDPARTPLSHVAVDQGTYASDTLQLRRSLKGECLLVDAPAMQAVAGALSGTIRTSTLTVTSPSPIGVVVVLSLDGKPVAESGSLLVKMVTIAANSGEQKSTRDAPPGSPALRLDSFGAAPVDTKGQPSDRPLSLDLAGKPLLRAYLVNGTWEALREGGQWYVWCDTPGIRFELPSLGGQAQVTPFTQAGAGAASTGPQPFAYPKGCRFVRVSPAS